MKVFKKSFLCTLLAVMLMLCGCAGTGKSVTDDSGRFSFTVLKAGQADAIILKTQNHSVILDTGEADDGDKISEYLKKSGIKAVDYILLTHFDKDHIGGFAEATEGITAKNILVPDYEGNGDAYTELIKTVNEKNLSLTRLKEDTSFILDGVRFEVSVPKAQSYEEDDNDYSLVLSVTHGENTFLFAGDAEKERLDEILSEISASFDFLKVPHHGKYNGNTEKFINVVKPHYAVITDSAKNPASDKTVLLLEAQNTEIYSTKNGDVSVISDGKKITINQ